MQIIKIIDHFIALNHLRAEQAGDFVNLTPDRPVAARQMYFNKKRFIGVGRLSG